MISSIQKDTSTTDVKVGLSPQQRALRELAESGLQFALLWKPARWEDTGDVDIIVANMSEADTKLVDLAYLRVLSREGNHKYVRYSWNDKQWVHLDVHSVLHYGTTQTPHKFMLALLRRARYSAVGIPCLDPTDEAILLILHLAIDKGSLNSKYREHVFRCDRSSLLVHAELYSFLPKPLGEYVDIIETLKEGMMSGEDAIRQIRSSFDLSGTKHAPLWKRILRRVLILCRGNPAVVFLGPDGAGKSTLSEPLARLRWPNVRRQFMGPERQSEMRKLFFVIMQWAHRLRSKYSKRHVVGIISRAIWQMTCYLDFWDRLIRHMIFCMKGGVLFCDRYPCDMYFRKPTRWNELLFLRWFPRPRFVFLCVGDAKAIHQRKPELSPDEINSTIELYRKKLAQYRIPYSEINTSESLSQEVLDRVVGYLIDNDWFRVD